MAPKGRRSNQTLQMVTPMAQALEQAKSDLKRGVHQRTIYDRVREETAMRKKLDRGRKTRRVFTPPKIQMISPIALALEQAKSDLKRGLDQTNVLDQALERDAKRKKRSKARKAWRAKWTRKSGSKKKSRYSTGMK